MTSTIFFVSLIDNIFSFYMFLLVARILISWFPDISDYPPVRFLRFCTDPYLNLFKRLIPPLGMLDFSPLVAIFALNLLELLIKSIVLR